MRQILRIESFYYSSIIIKKNLNILKLEQIQNCLLINNLVLIKSERFQINKNQVMKSEAQQRQITFKTYKSQQIQKQKTRFVKSPQKIVHKKTSVVSIGKQKSRLNCGVDNRYLNSKLYNYTCQFAKKRNVLYKNYCTAIQDYYIEFDSLYQRYNQKINPKYQQNQKISFVRLFKSFFQDFFFIFHQVSTVHIGYFTQISYEFNQKQQILQYNTSELVQNLRIYEKSQNQFYQNFNIHHNKLNQIFSKHQNLKRDEKDPYSYFNRKLMIKKSKDLIQHLNQQQRIRVNLRKDLDQVYQNSLNFQNNLIFFRQQLFSNKYKVLKKLTQMSKNSRNALAELLVYLFDCVSRRTEEFSKLMKQVGQTKVRKRSKSLVHSEDKLAVQSYLIQVTRDYSRLIYEIQNVLANASEFFQELRKFTTKQSENNQKILQLLNTLYDMDQNQNNQVFDALQFYFYFCTKICELNTGINIATNQFIKLRNQTKKLSQITISLVRNSSKLHMSTQKSLDAEQHNSQIEILLQKLSYDYPMNFIQNIYKNFQKSLTNLKNHASQKFHIKKRLVQDSMEISYLQQTIVKPQKRICQKQVWLWEKWQNQSDFKINEFKISSLSQIKQFALKFLEEISQAKQIDRYSCSLQIKGQTSGFLIITDKYIKFQTSQGNCILVIYFSEIDEVKVMVKMFGKIVVVSTGNGIVSFKGCIDAQSLVQSIEEIRNNSGAPLVKRPRQIVQITAEELASIEQRKQKIKSLLPKLQDFTFQKDLKLEGITIDHIYELIYADKQCTIRGKTEPIFFAYLAKKNGSSNYQCSKYDTLGPKFYSHDQGVTFLNCSEFSTRIINYDVKLPPIPFMPKYAQTRQECKLFWISNKQFQYLIHCNTSGAPKSDTFFIQVLHKVLSEDEKNCKIEMYWRIFFTQDSYLKSTIQSSAGQQCKRGIQSTISQIKKYCTLMSSTNHGEEKGIDQIQKNEEQLQERNNNQGGNGFLKNLISSVSNLIKNIFSMNNKKDEKSTKDKQAFDGQQSNMQDKKNKSKTNLAVMGLILIIVVILNLVAFMFKDLEQQ